jgi:hypothetical protein
MTKNMEKDTLELILNEMLEEQKNANKINTDLVSTINQLTTKVNSFNEKLEKQKIIAPPADIKPLQETVKKGLIQMQLAIAAQPRNMNRKLQLLLFPEQDAKLFYKIVFGRWFMWLAIMLFLNLVYKWAIHRADNDKQTMIEVLKSDKIVRAWNYLYEQKDKQLHKKMDSALGGSFFSSSISK